MKTTQLPPVRVLPAVREEIEASLQQGETLSQFIEKAALESARARKAQLEFLERGRRALATAQRKGEFFPAEEALAAMRTRLHDRMAELKQSSRHRGKA